VRAMRCTTQLRLVTRHPRRTSASRTTHSSSPRTRGRLWSREGDRDFLESAAPRVRGRPHTAHERLRTMGSSPRTWGDRRIHVHHYDSGGSPRTWETETTRLDRRQPGQLPAYIGETTPV